MEKEIEKEIKELIEEKNYDEILKKCNEVLQVNKEDSKAHFYKGKTYYDLGKYKESIENYNKAIEFNAKDYIAYNNRGLSKYYLKQYKEAIGDFDKAIEIKDDFKEAYNNKGLSKYYLKQYKEAIGDFDKAIEIKDDFKEAYNNRGLSKYYLKQYKEAIKDYNKAIEIKDDFKEAYNNRGLSKAGLKQYKEAIKDYNKAIEFNKEYSIAYNNRGVSKYYLKQYEKSINDYNKAIKLDKNYSIAYSNMGKSKYYIAFSNEEKFEYYKKAIKDFDKAIELKNKNQQTYILKSVCHLLLEEKDKVIDTFHKYYKDFKSNKTNFIIQIIMIAFDYLKKDNIDNIFDKLISNEYEELWKYDTIYDLLKREINSKNILSEDILKDIKNVLLHQYLLLKSLSFNNNEYNSSDIEISHYTSLNTLLLLLNDKKEDKENKEDEGKIRIVNISNANDPKEGKILESIFNKNGLYIKIIDNEDNLITLQTSYTRNKDSLTMFRLYGKNENKEATGICLVIDKEYFNDNFFSTPVQESSILTDDKNSNKNEEEQIDSLKRNLFWIIYYNEKENILIFNPKHSKYENIIINLDNIEKLKSKYDTKKGKTTLNDKKEIIEYIFSNIYYYTKELDKKTKDRELKNEIFSNLFENIKYIIKDEAFFEEQELRMLITTDYKNKNIKEDEKRLYINYIKLFDENSNYINEIILGSKIEDKELIADYIKQIVYKKYKYNDKMNKIKVSISKAPLR